MWEEGKRKKLGKIVVIEDETFGLPAIFMLDGSYILRYHIESNRWTHETNLPRKAVDDTCVGFVALDEELYVMTLSSGLDPMENRKPRQNQRSSPLLIQVYNPRKRSWRFIRPKPPFRQSLNFETNSFVHHKSVDHDF